MIVFSLALAVPQGHIRGLPGGALQYGHVRMHSWPGVTRYGLDWEVPAVDPEQRARYLEFFVGATDGRAGERVVQLAEEEGSR